MKVCPNCGYRHVDIEYAPELAEIVAPRKQHEVLLRLRQAKGALVSREQIIDFCYGDEIDGGPDGAHESIQSHVSKVKKKITKLGWTVTSERFRGYRLVRLPQ